VKKRRNVPAPIIQGLDALREYPQSEELYRKVLDVIRSSLAVEYNEGGLDTLKALTKEKP
jgi:hypothetical protein